MVETQFITGTLIYSHIIPALLGFLGVVFICSGIMDDKPTHAILGVILFFAAGVIPFLILTLVLGV
jgi:hypothetical protein